VKFRTKRFRGNVLDLEANAITIRADKGAGQERGGKRQTAENQQAVVQARLRTVGGAGRGSAHHGPFRLKIAGDPGRAVREMPGWLGLAGRGLLAEAGLPGLDEGPVRRRGAAESGQVAYLGERAVTGWGKGPRAPPYAQPA
jgi:hypothetical protein